MLYQQRFVQQTWGASVRPGARRRRRRARRAGLGRARAGLAYLSAERRDPEPHPRRTGRRDRRAQRRERFARIGASQRRRTTVAVDGARARLTVRRRS